MTRLCSIELEAHMTNDWSFWQAALENPRLIGKTPELIVTTEPRSGFYKSKFKGKAWLPVAIWQAEDGSWQALRNGKPVEADEVWTYCVRQPITHEAYERALEGDWAGDDPVVVAMLGHNIGDDDEAAALADQIEAAKQGAEIYRDITSEEEAGKAQSLRARMNELAGQADKIREKQKKPHWDAAQAVDKQWMPLVKEAKAVADQLRKYIESFKTAQLREQRRLEEERRREEAARLAEEARIREEIRAAEEAGLTPVVPPAPEPLPPPPPPITETTVKGTYGRGAAVRVVKKVTAITDQDALYQSLREHSDLKACLLQLAQLAVQAGQTVPGVEVEEVADIR
jgi:hypothetical protein